MNTIENTVKNLFNDGLTIKKIEELLNINIELNNEDIDSQNISESINNLNFTVKHILLG